MHNFHLNSKFEISIWILKMGIDGLKQKGNMKNEKEFKKQSFLLNVGEIQWKFKYEKIIERKLLIGNEMYRFGSRYI